MQYFGDEDFSDFLEMLKFPKTLPEIKAIVMRNLWRVRFQSMDVFLKELYTENEFSFPKARTAEIFSGNISALWNMLGMHQGQGNYFRFFKFPKTLDKELLKARIYTRNLEIQALLPLVTEGAKTIPAEHIKEFQNIAAPIIPAIEHMKTILGSAEDSFDDTRIAECARELNGMDAILEEAFNQLGWLFVKIWQKNQESDFTSAFN